MINYLVGNNIILRKAKISDLDYIYNNIWSDRNIASFMFWEPTSTYKDAIDRLNRSIEFQKNNYAYFICLKSSDEPIGFCGIKETMPGIFCETGLCIASFYQSKGYGKEVLGLLLDLAFNKLHALKFIYACREDNIKSIRLCQSFRFKFLYLKKELRKWDNKEFVCKYFELSKNNYLEDIL